MGMRPAVIVSLLAGSLLLSPFYYGGSINAFIVLIIAASALLGLTLNVKPLSAKMVGEPGLAVLPLVTLAYLVFVYSQSLVPGKSFTPTWILGLVPMAFLCTWSLPQRARDLLLRAIAAIVLLVAVVSVYRWAVRSIRPTEPMIDANNFATVMYLVWIPIVHAYIAKKPVQTHARTDPRWHGFAIAASFVLATAVVAVQSRAATSVLVVAIVVWIGLAAAGRVAWGRLGAVCLTLAGAFVLGSYQGFAGPFGGSAEAQIDSAIGVRGALNGAAWEMFLSHPVGGVGIMGFGSMYPMLRPDWEQETLGVFTHNDYLQFLAEGGVGLLLILLAFVGANLVAFLRGVAARPGEQAFDRLGFAMALCAACAHAAVNFMLYIPMLAILLGIGSAALFCRDRGDAATALDHRLLAPLIAALAFGWVSWSFLVLDNLTYGVFYAERFPGANWIRADADRALRFARIASQLNGDRALPYLGAANLLHQQALRERTSVYLRDQALSDYRRAIAIDAFNPVGYLGMAGHIAAFPALRDRLQEGESEEELYLKALTVDPVNVDAIEGLRRVYLAAVEPYKYYNLLKTFVFPRLEGIHRNGAGTVERYLDELQTIAEDSEDRAFVRRIIEERTRLADITPRRVRLWGATPN